MKRNNDKKSKKQVLVSVEKVRELQPTDLHVAAGGRPAPCPNSIRE